MGRRSRSGWRVPAVDSSGSGFERMRAGDAPVVVENLDEFAVGSLFVVIAASVGPYLVLQGMVVNGLIASVVSLVIAALAFRLALTGLAVGARGLRVRRLLWTVTVDWPDVEKVDVRKGRVPLNEWEMLCIERRSGRPVFVLRMRRPLKERAGPTFPDEHSRALWASLDAVADELGRRRTLAMS